MRRRHPAGMNRPHHREAESLGTIIHAFNTAGINYTPSTYICNGITED